MDRKGFTLVELLGVLVILSIIMLIAVPNVISIMDKNKKDIFISDARKFVSAVQYDLSKKSAYPQSGSCYVALSNLNNLDIGESPNKLPYSGDSYDSYVDVTNSGTTYTYTIYFTDTKFIINGIELSNLARSSITTTGTITSHTGTSCY